MVIIICGPTASGKTSLSLKLSDVLPSEIISSDSRQFYRFLNIGTAKPSKEELVKAPHHFIDFLDPDQDYNAGKFGEEAALCIENIFDRNKIPIVVGGSGLYIKSLTEGLFREEINERKFEIRKKLSEKYNEKGKFSLYDELVEQDPAAAAMYSDKNPRRVLRALEYYYLTGNSIINSRTENKIKRNFNFIQFGINFERAELYARINDRVVQMWNAGLTKELSNILKLGYSPELNSLNTVGYKETYQYLTGYLSESETIAEIQKNTRRFAKRQITWFKRDKNIICLNSNDNESEMIEELINVLFKIKDFEV